MGAVHHQKPLGQAGNIRHGVADHHNGGVLRLPVSLNIAQHLCPSRGVQAGGGLVQNQHFRFHGNHTGDRHPALLSAGQFKGRGLQLLRGKPHQLSRLPHPAVHLLLIQAHILGAEGDVLINRFFKQLVFGILKYQSHPEPALPGGGLIRPDVLSVQKNRAGGGAQQSVEMLHQGGFAGTGMADDSDKLSPLHRKGHILQRHMLKRGSGAVYMA